MQCHFCDSVQIKIHTSAYVPFSYKCKTCGHVNLTREAAEDFAGKNFSNEQKAFLRINNRVEFERNGRKLFRRELTLQNLIRIVENFTPISPLDKLDNALLIIEKSSNYFGDTVRPRSETDYPYYNCLNQTEMT